VDKDTITIAENLRLTIEGDIKEGYEIKLPGFGEKLGQFGIVDYQEEPPQLTDEGRILTKKTYTLEPFLSGEYKIAPMKVVFWPKSPGSDEPETRETHEIETEEVLIKVLSLLGEDREKLQINPIFGPVDLPSRPVPWTYVVVGLAALLGLIGTVAFYWHKRRRRIQETAVVIPAHELAYRQLQEILGENLLDKGEFKLFYAKISDVVRHYIENRFGLHAPKLTTEEFLAKMNTKAHFLSDHQRLLDEFLHHCDLVKFAEHQPAASEIQRTFNACKSFIEATKEQEAMTVNSVPSNWQTDKR
jgi:hypothetical protein